jgi:hypothetical protein
VHWLFAAQIAAWLVYVGYVGGDRFEFRFLVVIFPIFGTLVPDDELRRLFGHLELIN